MGREVIGLAIARHIVAISNFWRAQMRLTQHWQAAFATLDLAFAIRQPTQTVNSDSQQAAYGPTAWDWPLPGAWPAFTYGLVPDQVVDFCGGKRGVSKWQDVSKSCATWAVQELKCQQACQQTNVYSGFGTCMQTCAGLPQKDWCMEAPRNQKYCELVLGRWEQCEVNKNWEKESEWVVAIDKCVFTCDASLEMYKVVGELPGWRSGKCPPGYWACGAQDSPAADGPPPPCEKLPDGPGAPAECKFPVATGERPCFYEDPACGEGCERTPPPGAGPAPAPGLAPAPAAPVAFLGA